MIATDELSVSAESTLDTIRTQRQAGQLSEAERLCRQLLQTRPNLADAWYQLGRITNQSGNPQIAAAFFRKAIVLDSSVANYHKWRGGVLLELGQLAEAETSLRRAIEIDPRSAGSFLNLGGTLQQKFELTAAMACFERALEIDSNHAAAQASFGGVLCDQGRIEEGIERLRIAVDLQPDNVEAHSNLLFLLHYAPSCDRETLLGEARNWGIRHGVTPANTEPTHPNTPDPDRKLRIGYVSGDFHSHPVGYFLEAVLQCHDKSQVEVYCYSNHRGYDELTRRIRDAADHGRSIAGVPDQAVDDAIRRDGIDILVDLSGHTAGHRLALFARKPAPVQATWIGYFDTTGVPAIDYVILDNAVCPPGNERFYTENVVRLPDSYLCYAPQPSPEVSASPVLARGHITFGCFNKASKVNADVVALWAKILQELPDARLCLKNTSLEDAEVRRRFADQFASHGVSLDRLTFLGRSPYTEYMAAYGEIDIALDPFPFNGGTTTVEGLWMGIPLVTLAGDHFVSRMGVTYLSQVGLSDLIADSPDEYVRKAVALANDVSGLVQLRDGLRQRVKASTLCDGPRFTRGLEAAYRAMWHRWCRSRQVTTF